VALVINELVSNSAKYAYPDRPGGSIWVRLARADERAVLVSVRDEGVGLPQGFDPAKGRRLGARLVKALSRQLGAELTQPSNAIGTCFDLFVPLEPVANP
jgi:two-component sensor histidine kinase